MIPSSSQIRYASDCYYHAFPRLMNNFMPHGYCMRWDFWLVVMHVASDVVIALAYFSIPAALVIFVRQRKGLKFSFIFWLFSLFIFSCGVTHLFEIYVLWHPVYWAEGWAKVITALASIFTAICLWRIIPVALRIPSVDELVAANEKAHQESIQRTEAERGNRLKDEFLATLSHELRTPLSAIVGWTELLQSQRLPLEKVPEALDIIRRNAGVQEQLVNDLLDLSRIASGKMRLENRTLNLTDVIETVVASLKPSAAAHQITLETSALPVAMVTGDPERLQQIIWNLLTNALKFTPPDGRVSVSVTAQGENFVFAVQDTGKGIATDFLPHVFDRFRQADSSFSRAQGGLGIGLALVKELVLLHGGTVRAESNGPNLGSTFSVELPQARTPAGLDSKSSPPPSALPSILGLSVLVVDDEPDMQKLLQEIFEQAGASVRAVGSAEDALRAIEHYPPDIIVSDIAMPDHDGIWLIKELRRLDAKKGGSTPAIALTAQARESDRLAALAAGFQTHLAKPLESQQLIEAVAHFARAGEIGRAAARS